MTYRILLVEDSATQAEALRSLLASAGYEVTLASSGEEALARFEAFDYDVVLSDIVMPGSLDGYGLCQHIKAGPKRETPVILLTSLSDPMDIIKGLEGGADNFFTKPYAGPELLDRLNTLFDTKTTRKQPKMQMGVTVFFMGREFNITSEREQILDLLISTFETAVHQNRELREREAELLAARAELTRYAQSLETRLENVLSSIPDVLFSVSPDWKLMLYFSPASDRVFGHPPEAMTGEYWHSLIHPDDCERVITYRARALESRSTQTIEYRIQHPSGSTRWISQIVVPVLTTDGAVSRLDGVARDITDQKFSEERMRWLTLAVEQSPAAVVITDMTGRIQYVNEKFSKITGYDAGEATGKNPNILKSGKTPPEVYRDLWTTIHAGGEWRGEILNRKKDGELFWNRAFISPIRDATGATTHFLAIQEDVTAQKKLQEQLSQAQKMESIGQLAGGVAHDFNNLLSVILGETEIALSEIPGDDMVGRGLEAVRSAAHRAAGLTRQLLAFSRQEIVEPTVFNINSSVEETDRMLLRLIGEDIDRVLKVAPDLGAVKIDRGQFEQVLMNLAVNARDAMPDGGMLAIETANITLDEQYHAAHPGVSPGDYVMLAVSDSGTGMTPEVQQHVFEPFFTTKEPGRGTGLGLATCYGIVKQAGGNIEVYSEPGAGTTVRVYLPRVQESVQPPVASVAPTRLGGNETILLVEDEESVRKIAARILTKLGYCVLTAATPAEALQLFEEKRASVQLLLTDLVLPGMNGRLLAEHARSLRPDLPVLYASGYTRDVTLRNNLIEQRDALVHKPFTAESLARKVREVLDASRAG